MSNLKSLQEVSLYVGESKTWVLSVERDGEPRDLTGCAIDAEVKASDDDDAEELIGWHLPAGQTAAGGWTLRTQGGDTLGQAELSAVPDDTHGTDKPAPDRYRIAVWVTWPNGERKPVVTPRDFVLLAGLIPP